MSPAPAPVSPLVFHWFYAKATGGAESEDVLEKQRQDQQQQQRGEAGGPSETPDWQPFSRADSAALERHYQTGESDRSEIESPEDVRSESVPSESVWGVGGSESVSREEEEEDVTREDTSQEGEQLLEDASLQEGVRRRRISSFHSFLSQEEREEKDPPRKQEEKEEGDVRKCFSRYREDRREDEEELSDAESWHEDWTELDWLTDWFGDVPEETPNRKRKPQLDWVPFCKADSDAIETAFLGK